MILVIDGGCTVSCLASPPGIIVAGRPGAASCVPESPGCGPGAIRPARSLHASRVIKIRSAVARWAPSLGQAAVIVVSQSH